MKFGTTDVRMAQCLIREVCGLALMPDEHDRRVAELLKLPENLLQACFEALVGPRTVVAGEDVGFKDGWWRYIDGRNLAHYFEGRKSLCDIGGRPTGWVRCESEEPVVSVCGTCREVLAKREDATPAPSKVEMAQALVKEWNGFSGLPAKDNPKVVELSKRSAEWLTAKYKWLIEYGEAEYGWWQNRRGTTLAHFFQGEIALCSLDKGDDLGWLPCDPHGLAQHQICNTCADELKKPERVGDAVHDALREALPKTDVDMEKVKDVLRDEPPASTARPDWIDTPDWFDKKYGGKEFKTGTIYNLIQDLADVLAKKLRPHHEDAERG